MTEHNSYFLLNENSVMMDTSNENNNSNYEYFEDMNLTLKDSMNNLSSWEYRFAVPTIFVIFLITGTLGNGLVVSVFIKNKTFRTITNMFLWNLAVTDLMYLLFCVPFAAANYYKKYWIFGNTLYHCLLVHRPSFQYWVNIQSWRSYGTGKFVQYMMTVCLSLHVLTLTAVGIDRYLAIVHPIVALSLRTKKRCIIVIFAIWIISLLTFVPVILINNERKVYNHVAYCLEELNKTDSRIYAIAMLVVFYLIPQFVLGFCYVQIALQMRATVNTKSRFSTITNVYIKRRGRLVKLVAIVTLAFAISWLPLHVAVVSASFDNSYSAFTYHVQNIAPCFSYANSVVNPFIYSFMSKTFRKYFQATFKCRSINITSSLLADDAVLSTHDRRHGGIELRSVRSVRHRATQTPRPVKPQAKQPIVPKKETEASSDETVTNPLVESLV